MYKHLRSQSDVWIGAGIAVLAVLILNFPLWLGLCTTDEIHRPDIVIESSDEEFYLTRIKEAADGYPWVGNPFVYELRTQHYPLGSLWENVLGLPVSLGVPLKTVMTLADAIFPFLLVLLVWVAVRPVLPEKKWRILLIGILFLGFEMTFWKRPISPQQTMVLPLLWLWAFVHPQRTSMKFTAIRGALIGLMTLSYPFHWTYCIVAEALQTSFLLHKERTWKERVRRVLSVTIPFLICALPWITMMLAHHGDVAYAQTLERLGMLARRFPSGIPLQFIILIVGAVTVFARRKMNDKSIPNALLMLLGASLIVLNQQLITGKEAEFSNHYKHIILFPLWTSALFCLRFFVPHRRNLPTLVPVAGVIIVAFQTAQSMPGQMALYAQMRGDTAAREERISWADALNEIKGEQVILIDYQIGQVLTISTRHYPFFLFETHMYPNTNANIYGRARVQQAVVRDYSIPLRAIVGSYPYNKALHERTLCKVRTLLNIDAGNCEYSPESFVPKEWTDLNAAPPTEKEILRTLKDAHVSYAFLRNPPKYIADIARLEKTVGAYQLLRFDWALLPKGE